MASKSDTNSNLEFRRKRGFWTLQAKNILYRLVQPQLHVIDDNGNSSVMVRKKFQVWDEIRKKMDLLGYAYDVKQLKAQYFRYKLAQKEMQLNKHKEEVGYSSPSPAVSDLQLGNSKSAELKLKPEYRSEADCDATYGRLNGSGDSNTDRIIQVAEIIDENLDDHEMEISSTPSTKRRLMSRPRKQSSSVYSRLNLLIQRKRLKQVDHEIFLANELHNRNMELKTVQLDIEKHNLQLIKLRLDNERKRGQMCSCVRQYVTNSCESIAKLH